MFNNHGWTWKDGFRGCFLCSTALIILLLHPQLSTAAVLLDDFNRPDSSDMGAAWVEQTGDFRIDGGEARSNNLALMTYTGVTGLASSVDVHLNPLTDPQYVALVLGYADLSNNLFVKVQRQSGGSGFFRIFFYYGNNGDNWGTGTNFFDVPVFQSARMSLTLTGAVATLDLDTDFDGDIEHTLSKTGTASHVAGLGTGIGLGGFGEPFIDNFGLGTGLIPEPTTSSFILISSITLLYRRRSHSLT